MPSTPIENYELALVLCSLNKDKPTLPDTIIGRLEDINFCVTKRRLRSITDKLVKHNVIRKFDHCFDWSEGDIDLGFIFGPVPTPVKESLRIRILNKIEQWVK